MSDVTTTVVRIINTDGTFQDVAIKDISNSAIKTEMTAILGNHKLVVHGKLIKKLR